MKTGVKTVGIVQARMTSTRLPGKILKEVLGKPLLQYELERLRRIPSLDGLVVATTTNADDDPVIALCEKMGVASYRGSEHDVLSRYYEAASARGAESVVRFTADCPLIDPGLSEKVIRFYLDNKDSFGYCCADVSSYPRGTDTEIFSFKALAEAHAEGHTPPDREHVTYFIRMRPERYRRWSLTDDRGWGRYRLTVDTPEDFALIKAIIERLYPSNENFTIGDVAALLEREPALAAINESVKQKKI
jgi:spore coat polysaccharide biosynthesis protein SpsF